MESIIKIRIRDKNFIEKNNKLEVLRNINIDIQPGEFFCIYGPNACGKTTMLKIIADLDNNFNGEINRRSDINKIGFIFQNYKESLFPWWNNFDNISYFFRLKGLPKRERLKKVNLFLEKYGLDINLRAYPYQQSGGQQQLISTLRAMVIEPNLLIMDEPFSSLDHRIRLKMCDMIQKYWKDIGGTILFVSHDLDESLLLAERVLVMRKLNESNKDSVLKILTVDFPRPRQIELIESMEFFNMKSEILSLLRKDLENE